MSDNQHVLTEKDLKRMARDWANAYAMPVADPYEDIPLLITEVRRLRAQVEALTGRAYGMPIVLDDPVR